MIKPNQKITAKQEKACQVFIETGCKTAAYREAYSTGKMKPNTINRKAAELFETEIVMARVVALQAEHRAAHDVTIERLTADLELARQMAHKEGQAGAAVSATVAQAKLHGFMIDRSKVETRSAKDMTKEEMREELRQIAIEEIREGGRDYIVKKIAEFKNLLEVYDTGKFEEYVVHGVMPTRH